jgi:alkylation response protein AidB-like acyl-CoA dehydrogenase
VTTTTSPTTGEQMVRARAQQLVKEHDPKKESPTEFWGAQYDAGLAWVSFPEGQGGLGLSPQLQQVVDDVLRAASAPINFLRNPIGVGMAAGTILAHGRPDQIERYLRPNFTCEEVWCQLFSEPGAGSDLAGLATRAVRDGDEWVVNGQKVWTTLAHTATWGLLVARTDPEAPKHRGLTYFVVDMHAPGVEVRPLRQATGEAEFNEVYFTDARIPDSQRLGDVGDGWRVSLTTLMNERVAIGGGVSPRGSGYIGNAVKIWQDKHGANGDPVLRDRLMTLWVAAEAARLTNARAAQNRQRGTPGPEGSIGKIMAADLNKQITSLCIDLLGMEGTLYSTYEMIRPESAALAGDDHFKNFLRARANSIEGGTSEIMRNILGERVLGLPGDARVDKELPWSKVPRN